MGPGNHKSENTVTICEIGAREPSRLGYPKWGGAGVCFASDWVSSLGTDGSRTRRNWGTKAKPLAAYAGGFAVGTSAFLCWPSFNAEQYHSRAVINPFAISPAAWRYSPPARITAAADLKVLKAATDYWHKSEYGPLN